MKTTALVAILGGLVASAAAPQPSAPVPKDPAVTEADFGPRQPALETPWFAFYSHFGFNLYDAVLTSATERGAERPDPAVEGECFAGLVGEERGAWNAAVGYFGDTLAGTSAFSRERLIVRAHLVGVEIPGGLDDDDRRDLALSLLFLRTAAPAYRACRWPEQDVVNRRWIADLEPRLARHADTIAGRLQPLFGVEWRSRPLWVDVVAKAGSSGADTTDFRGAQTHTQINSRDASYQGPAALEMIFHEASHELVWPRGQPTADAFAAASQQTGIEVPRSLWHGALFVTVGEVVRQVLGAAGEGLYLPFAEKHPVFQGDWEPLHQPLLDHWIPFLRGEISREEAARRVLYALRRERGKQPGG